MSLLVRARDLVKRPVVTLTGEDVAEIKDVVYDAGTGTVNGFTLDTAARTLTAPGGEDVALTTGEFDLLCAFAQHPGRVLSRDFLLEHTRGREAAPFDRTIDVQVGRLRKKLEAEPEEPQIIKSVRGAGYILVPAVEQT